MEAPPDLQALRERIEALDRELLALLKRRMGVSEEVARAKLAAASPFRDPPREEQVFGRVRHLAAELGLDPHEVERLYRVVLDMSVARQQAYLQTLDQTPLRVAYQGVEGSFSHLAAQARYAGRAGGAHLTGFATFRGAAAAVLAGEADVAFLPIENSTAGSINETYDLLAEGGVTINAEVVRAIEHCLLARPGSELATLSTVLSHPQALRQCEEFFQRHPHLVAREEFDTAGAARKVAESHDPTLSAIASEAAAKRFGLVVLARGIQTRRENYTRFVEVAREPVPCPPEAACKTSLLLACADRPGALGEILAELARRGVNLTKLESRPWPDRPWHYRFYLDLEGHASSSRVAEALAAIRPLTSQLTPLGTYPRAAPAIAGED
ncbi:MAG: prephenate dehydratase [Thermoanaerobaculia bacterium]